MACKYTAPNGNKSKLYDSVYKVHGHKTALKAWATAQTKSFQDWYTGEVDKNGRFTRQHSVTHPAINFSFKKSDQSKLSIFIFKNFARGVSLLQNSCCRRWPGLLRSAKPAGVRFRACLIILA